MPRYDVFLSHASADKPAVEHLARKLRNEGLVSVSREGTFLRYGANTETLQELLGFLYAECCTRNKAIEPQCIVTSHK